MPFSATHAVVMARLMISQVDHGVHPFVVQVKCLDNGRPVKGIEYGDIGLKGHLNEVDNGYIIFNTLQILRRNLLSRHAQVLRDGTYIPAKDPKTQYSPLMFVHSVITEVIGAQLAQGTTIAARYSVVRRQGFGPNGKLNEEIPIIHYKSQHYRLLTWISKAYVIHFAANSLNSQLADHFDNLIRGDTSMAHHLHILSSSFKAFATTISANGTEDCRKLCGGQGYLALNGLTDLIANAVAYATLEGENYVLLQQVYRHILSGIHRLEAGKPVSEDLQYLASCLRKFQHCPYSKFVFLNPEHQRFMYIHRSSRLAF